MVIEFNRYGPMRSGATGNQLKDRSVGTVVRFNRIEGGAHSMDLVEAEDFPKTALANPAYRSTYVYGNHLINGSGSRAIVHYGGDHFGSTPGGNWGEPLFRKGTLYFYNNTVVGTGSIRLFRVSTTEESVQAWNNTFWSTGAISVREGENDGIGSAWTADGPINLGVNWIKSGYGGATTRVTGTASLLQGSTAPFDATTLVPLAGSSVLDVGTANLSGASGYPVNYQISSDGMPTARKVNGAAIDLGAIER